MVRVVKSSKTCTRIDTMTGGVCQVIDGIVSIISLGYIATDLYIRWIDVQMDRTLRYFTEVAIEKENERKG